MVGADLEVAADVDDDLVQEIGQRLKQAGVEPGRDQTGASTRPVVFVCGRLRKEYDRCLARWSKIQCRRVLVLSTASTPPPPDSMWRVVGSVAEEILHWDATPATIEDIRGRLARWQEIDALVDSGIVQGLVGRSPAFLAVLRQLVEAAHFTDDPILITGETGTGKEVAARLVHALDRKRKRKDLAIVDCGAIVPTLSGSEFFGHDRGAFTGAIEARDGAFALADGGILFLDEVGELPPDLQVQLLRVVQEKRYKRVGSNTWRDTDFRLLAATNRDLWAEVEESRFRRDLYYRLTVWPIALPPLAERMEDVLPLAEHFLADGADGEGRPVLTPAVQAYLLSRQYPGNVRDLKQLCMRLRGRHVGSPRYTAGDVPVAKHAQAAPICADWRDGAFEEGIRRAIAFGSSLKDITSAAADTAVRIALDGEQSNVGDAAKALQVTPRALQLRRQKDRSDNGT